MYLPIILSIYLPAHLATYPPSPSLLANKAGKVPTRSNVPSYQLTYLLINHHNFAIIENDDGMDKVMILQTI